MSIALSMGDAFAHTSDKNLFWQSPSLYRFGYFKFTYYIIIYTIKIYLYWDLMNINIEIIPYISIYYLFHTCGLYKPRNDNVFNQTGAWYFMETSDQNYIWHSPSLQRSRVSSLRRFSWIFLITISSTNFF